MIYYVLTHNLTIIKQLNQLDFKFKQKSFKPVDAAWSLEQCSTRLLNIIIRCRVKTNWQPLCYYWMYWLMWVVLK